MRHREQKTIPERGRESLKSLLYNKYMGGVDRFGQFCSKFNRKAMKWYQTLWHFIIQVALINGWLGYNLENKTQKLTDRGFREMVIDGLFEGFRKDDLPIQSHNFASPLLPRLSGRHIPKQYADKRYQ
ncbi:hypothetical protein J437_LFUL013203 [Ladona fulva]|uniref:PiggyBac transposable element-derived protein domain-containing protein n=1 Tax=Ladona fulva TaxID=123851 RepID=A0A8K0P333_LADFU|nr:hypothetical protein J437_LFUL013203 [Ladona fulva]